MGRERFTAPFVGIKPKLRGWMHAAAAPAAIALAPILIVKAPPGSRLITAIYAFAVVGLFSISAIYHRFAWNPVVRGFWKRLDHSMIFVVIAATYTPVAVFLLPDSTAKWILITVWSGAAIGIATQLVWPTAPNWMIVIPYLLCGWAITPAITQVWDSLGVGGFALLVSGGMCFTVGAIVYALKRPDPWPSWFGYHEIFHVFVTAGIALHYVLVAFVAIPRVGAA